MKQTSKGPVRLAFDDNEVVEAKNMKTGMTHTPKEFSADRMDRPMMASMSKAKRPPKFRKKFANAGEVDQYAARPKHRVMV